MFADHFVDGNAMASDPLISLLGLAVILIAVGAAVVAFNLRYPRASR